MGNVGKRGESVGNWVRIGDAEVDRVPRVRLQVKKMRRLRVRGWGLELRVWRSA